MLDGCREIVPESSADSLLQVKVRAGKFHLLVKIKLDYKTRFPFVLFSSNPGNPGPHSSGWQRVPTPPSKKTQPQYLSSAPEQPKSLRAPQPALGGRKLCLPRHWQERGSGSSWNKSCCPPVLPCCPLGAPLKEIRERRAKSTSTPATLLFKGPLPPADPNECHGFPAKPTKGLRINLSLPGFKLRHLPAIP